MKKKQLNAFVSLEPFDTGRDTMGGLGHFVIVNGRAGYGIIWHYPDRGWDSGGHFFSTAKDAAMVEIARTISPEAFPESKEED